jgi:hypothetical protein
MIEVTAIFNEEVPMRRKLDGTAYMTVKDLADRAGVAPTTVYYWISQGLVKAERTGLAKKSPMRISVVEAERVLAELGEPESQPEAG